MATPLPCLFLSLALSCIVSDTAALAQVKGAVVQTWNYDPTHNPPLVTVKIVNNSHKDITAFNIAIKETYANGRVLQHEMLEELVGKIINFKQVEGTAYEASFRKLYGDGVFHAGTVWDEKSPVKPGLTDYQAVIDTVVYIDGTAETTNNDAFGRVISERKAALATRKMTIQIIKAALADPNDPDSSRTAAQKMRDQAAVSRHSQQLQLDPVVFESTADEIKIVSSRNPFNKREALKQLADKEDAELSILSVHAALVKTGGPQ